MANVPISGLPAATQIDLTGLVPIVNGAITQTEKATWQQAFNFIKNLLALPAESIDFISVDAVNAVIPSPIKSLVVAFCSIPGKTLSLPAMNTTPPPLAAGQPFTLISISSVSFDLLYNSGAFVTTIAPTIDYEIKVVDTSTSDGDVFPKSLTTDAIFEGGVNLFFTDARADARVVRSNVPFATKTGNYTVLATDYGLVADTTAGGFTFTLPLSSTISGKPFVVYKPVAANSLICSASGGDVVYDFVTNDADISVAGAGAVVLRADGGSRIYVESYHGVTLT